MDITVNTDKNDVPTNIEICDNNMYVHEFINRKEIMRTFIYTPGYHGPKTFIVVARNKKEARKLVDNYIEKNMKSHYDYNGWTEGYELTILKDNEIFIHDND